jgi:hypothetical protein
MQGSLSKKHGELEAGILASRIQQRYVTLYAKRSRFQDRRLQFHVDHLIMPVLALYQVLLEMNDDAQETLDEVGEIIGEVLMNKMEVLIRLMRYFPDPFYILRRIVLLVNQIVFPKSGWVIDYITDDDQVIAFDIHGCFFVDVLADYGVPELAQVFCRFDDDIGALFPPDIGWKRKFTLARGGSFCDFRYEKQFKSKRNEE